MLPILIAIVLGTAVLLCVRSYLSWRSRSRGLPLPPGPPGLPMIGNMLNIPKFKQWLGFKELSAIYGDVMHFRVLNDHIVVLGDAETIMEYLDKSSATTADRKESVLIELTGADVSFGFMPYGNWWRRHRRAFWQHFRPQAIAKYYPAQRTMVVRFLERLLQDPVRFEAHIRYTFSAALMEMLYGIQVSGENDEYIAKAEQVVEGVAEGLLPGRYLVEVLPFLRYLPHWFPGAGFQKRFAAWRAASEDLWNAPVARVKEAMERQEGVRCIVGDLLSGVWHSDVEKSALAEEEEIVKDVAAVAFEAGSDTTFSTLQTIFLAMSLYPEVLKNAQAELDAVVGPARLPNFSDKDSLVYVNAIIREASRWIPVTPLGVPHCTIEDDELRGYFIPKGTVLMPNVWACMHDPEVYRDPDVFRPERFIRDGKLDVSTRDPFQFTFGFGRRICPGRYFAESALFINVAAVLHTFDISPPIDEDGVPVKITPDTTDGLLAHPQDCRCTITPRSPESERLIRDSARLECQPKELYS
ncbi:CyP450 monooxygenase [Lentinus tigrinus ALCF2SS1-6]|uniref:CyP450 monooxygenase n=1 Tax=Lentinus tigrinus ALCF2SS1-6 TaxID=1328759 RepID=A0A5C2SCU0_9APHY|nr:CyP450 monooxygenase [Lentinus tigrinus ALCF2SS1-6]